MRMLTLGVWMMLAATAFGQTIDITMTVDFGRDAGQNLGTLFEARDSDGRRVFGAGYSGAFNTRNRSERYMVQFFVRPEDDASYTIEPLPRFSDDMGVYLYPLGDRIIALAHGDDYGKPVQWNEAAQTWDAIPSDQNPGYGFSQVRGKTLACMGNRIYYDGQMILGPADVGSYGVAYYGNEHLQFYHRHDAPDDSEDFIRAVAVPWSPYDEDLAVDMSKAITMDLSFVAEFPYSWGQLDGKTINCSNWGGVYAFDGTQWQTLVAADDKTSYQLYAMINYGDKLYMAHYPSGFLYCYDGNEITTLHNEPPVPAQASPSAREAQTLQIYRGELFVGVWPWSELWRLDPDTQSWSMLQRMFTHPPMHVDPVHAYQNEAAAAGLVVNVLGQRLTSLEPYRDGMFIATSSKDGKRTPLEHMTFVSESQRKEYGEMYRMTMPGNLAALMTWKDEPTTLRFVADGERMMIYQDGELIGETTGDIAPPSDAHIVTGRGVYGSLDGAIQAFESR